MFSEETWTLYTNYLTYGTNFNLFPFYWNSQKQKLEYQTSKWRLALYRFAILWYTLDIAYLAVVVHDVSKDPNVNMEITVKIILHFATRLGCLLGHFFMLKQKRRLSDFSNQLFQLSHQLEIALRSSKYDPRNAVICAVYAAYFQSIVPVANYLIDYRLPHYWPSRVIPDHIYEIFMARIPFLLVEYYISALAIFVGTFYCLSVGIFASFMTFYGGVLRDRAKWIVQTSRIDVRRKSALRRFLEIKKLCRIYRKLQVLTTFCNDANRDALWPVMMSFMLLGQVGVNVAAIGLFKTSDDPPPTCFLFALCSFALLLSNRYMWDPSGRVPQVSSEFVQELKKSPHKVFQKFAKSCRVIQLEVGSVTKLKRGTTLKFVQAVLDYTATLVLSYFS